MESKQKKTVLTKQDAFIIIILLAAAAVFFAVRAFSANALTAQISVNGNILYTVDLNEDKEYYEIALDNGIVIAVENHSVRFLSSPCKTGECVKCGALTSSGDTAVCLPNKTLIKLYGKTASGEPDAIAY